LFPFGSLFAYEYTGTQNGWELLSHPPYSLDLALLNYYFFGPLKDHLRSHHYETNEAVQEDMGNWLQGAGIFKILQRW
jgi:hypothetical protein